MNNQPPSQARCGRQPELGQPAGWLASKLCLRMESPWLGATLPWQRVERQGRAVRPGGPCARGAAAERPAGGPGGWARAHGCCQGGPPPSLALDVGLWASAPLHGVHWRKWTEDRRIPPSQ